VAWDVVEVKPEPTVALIKGLEKQREQVLHQPPIDYEQLEAEAKAKAKDAA